MSDGPLPMSDGPVASSDGLLQECGGVHMPAVSSRHCGYTLQLVCLV